MAFSIEATRDPGQAMLAADLAGAFVSPFALGRRRAPAIRMIPPRCLHGKGLENLSRSWRRSLMCRKNRKIFFVSRRGGIVPLEK
jgi:hypothetical protein